MKMKSFFAFVLLCLILCLTLCPTTGALAGSFRLVSQDVADGAMLHDAQVLNGFGCLGGNRSPALEWRDPPAGTQSFAVTVYDPDASTGSGWWHWVIFDIPATTAGLPADAGSAGGGGLPAGSIQSLTDFGAPGFGGACPPQGDQPHSYVFTVHALDVPSLGLDAKAMPALVGFMLHQHSIGKAAFTARYAR